MKASRCLTQGFRSQDCPDAKSFLPDYQNKNIISNAPEKAADEMAPFEE